jgi:hypothetical protein
MVNFQGLIFPNNRTVIIFCLAVLLFIASLAAAHHLSAAIPSGPTSSTSLKQTLNSNSSAPAEEFSNSDTGSQDSGVSQQSSRTSVTVNGQAIPVPDSGSYSQTINNGDGSTTTINSQSSHTQSNTTTNNQVNSSNSSSVHVQVNSSSNQASSGDSL